MGVVAEEKGKMRRKFLICEARRRRAESRGARCPIQRGLHLVRGHEQYLTREYIGIERERVGYNIQRANAHAWQLMPNVAARKGKRWQQVNAACPTRVVGIMEEMGAALWV